MVSCLPGDDAKLYRYKALVSRGVGGGRTRPRMRGASTLREGGFGVCTVCDIGECRTT